MLGLDVGYELIRVVDPSMGGMLVERISAWRRQVAAELGIVIPPVHIRDNLELAPGDYRFLLLGANVASGAIRGGRLLAMDANALLTLVGFIKNSNPITLAMSQILIIIIKCKK